MTIDPVLAVPFAIAALFLMLGIATAITCLAWDRARRAEDRATIAETLLERHGIRLPERPGSSYPKE
jgi:hypothetical protein